MTRAIKVIPPFQVVLPNLIPVTIQYAQTPTIENVPMALAGTEYSYTFPTNTRLFTLKSRLPARLQVSYISGQTGIKFLTIAAGVAYSEIYLQLPSVTIYAQSSVASNTLEVVSWV